MKKKPDKYAQIVALCAAGKLTYQEADTLICLLAEASVPPPKFHCTKKTSRVKRK